jgi:hypothetical protein
VVLDQGTVSLVLILQIELLVPSIFLKSPKDTNPQLKRRFRAPRPLIGIGRYGSNAAVSSATNRQPDHRNRRNPINRLRVWALRWVRSLSRAVSRIAVIGVGGG